MANSKTQLANLALSRIGETNILYINDTTNDAARQCKRLLQPVIREVGRTHKWNCLKARAQLAQDSPAPAFGWDYSYTLPALCLQLVTVNGYSMDTAYIQDYYEIEGRAILTDATECKITYIAYTDDVTKFDSLLDRCVVALLSSYLASIVAGDNDLAVRLRQEYEEVVLPRAMRIDAQEMKQRKYSLIDHSGWLNARRIQPGEGFIG
jgi:hypothetical protein